jgi:hypothetical protein
VVEAILETADAPQKVAEKETSGQVILDASLAAAGEQVKRLSALLQEVQQRQHREREARLSRSAWGALLLLLLLGLVR